MSLIGKKVESFKAKAFHNGQFIDITDENMRGKWSAVVFYPADFTFVCPTELEDLANLYEDFKKENCEIYSVSTDTEYVHKAWHDSSERVKKVQYPMIADPTGKLSRMFEVMIEEEGLALRGSFIIDPEGVVQAYEVHSNGIGRETSELLRKLQAAKFVRENGEVCPAKWKPGKESLKPTIDLIGKL